MPKVMYSASSIDVLFCMHNGWQGFGVLMRRMTWRSITTYQNIPRTLYFRCKGWSFRSYSIVSSLWWFVAVANSGKWLSVQKKEWRMQWKNREYNYRMSHIISEHVWWNGCRINWLNNLVHIQSTNSKNCKALLTAYCWVCSWSGLWKQWDSRIELTE